MAIKDFLINKQLFLHNMFPPKWRKAIKNNESFNLYPVISISREPGSGGKPIAKLLAKELKFTFYDKQLINLIAKDAKKEKEIIKEFDEKAKSEIS